MTSAAGSTRSTKAAATTMPDGAGEPEATRRREEREQQGQQADDDRDRAGEDGLGRAAQGERHRLAPVVVAAQLVAVARDEQQGVVGAGAEDEHREDADRRLVPHDVERRERVGREHGRQPVGHADDDEREDPEDRAAVGEHEQQRHDRGGRDEQACVGPGEDGGEVGLDRGRARHLGGDAVGQVGLDGRADLLDGLGGRGRVVGVHRHDREQRRAVLAALQRRPAGTGHLRRAGPRSRCRSLGDSCPESVLKTTTAVDPSASGSCSRSSTACALSEPIGRASVADAVRVASPTALTTPIAPARARMTMATAHHLRVILSVTERTSTSAKMSTSGYSEDY